jgi:hypothetical protein
MTTLFKFPPNAERKNGCHWFTSGEWFSVSLKSIHYVIFICALIKTGRNEHSWRSPKRLCECVCMCVYIYVLVVLYTFMKCNCSALPTVVFVHRTVVFKNLRRWNVSIVFPLFVYAKFRKLKCCSHAAMSIYKATQALVFPLFIYGLLNNGVISPGFAVSTFATEPTLLFHIFSSAIYIYISL